MSETTFDALHDIAFAEVYHYLFLMAVDKKYKIDIGGVDATDLAKFCKEVAEDFCEHYEFINRNLDAADDEWPPFISDLYVYAEDRILEKYGTEKTYQFTIKSNAKMYWFVKAKNEEEAQEQMKKLIESGKYWEKFRECAVFEKPTYTYSGQL